jgi:hypothetical protein
LRVAFVRGCLSPGTAEARSWHAACAVSERLAYFAVCLDYRLPVVRCPPWTTMGVMQARILGVAEEKGMIHWEYGAVDGVFSPWPGWGRGRRPRGQGKGPLIHSLTEGCGMPLAHRTTPANGDERAQVLLLLDTVQVRRGKRGRPRKRLSLPQLKAMRRKRCGRSAASAGSGRKFRSGSGRRKSTGVDRSQKPSHACKRSAPLPGFRRSSAA